MSSPLTQILAQILAGAGGMVPQIIEIPPGVDPADFMAEFAEKMEVEHRKGCADCMARYEAEMKAKAQSDIAATAAMKKAQGFMDEAGFGETKQGVGTAARTPIGHMVFTTYKGETRPANGSFHADREMVERKLENFMGSKEIQAMRTLTEAIGTPMATYEIRPVFGE